MLKYIILILVAVSLVSCDGPLEKENGPGPLNSQQKLALFNFLADISDLVGAHATVGIGDRATSIRLTTRALQIRSSLETYGCKFNIRNSNTDYPIGRDVTELTEMAGTRCPVYRLNRRNIVVSRSDEDRNQSAMSGSVEFLFKPNDGALTELEFRSLYSTSQVSNPKGGAKTYYSSTGKGVIQYGGTKYAFKVGNDSRKSQSIPAFNTQYSWWEFDLGAFTAVITHDGSSCTLNGSPLNSEECLTMIGNLRATIDPVVNP